MENQKRMINSDYPDRMRLEWQGTRAFFYGLGYNDADMEKPRVGIMNTWNEINPGHIHQQHLADAVREGIIENGGLPFLFYGVNLCDCVAFGDYVLPSRDLLVNEIEVNSRAHRLDAMVLIGSCDKVVPAMLMAAARVNIPTIIVTGGYMVTPKLNGKYVDFIDIGASITKVKEGKMSMEEFDKIIHVCTPGSGACGMMGTANTMSILCETIGMSLPFNSTMAALSGDLINLSREAGRQVMQLWRQNIRPRDIITEQAITNAIRVCMAIGGSSNTIIHIPAIATEACLDMDCSSIYAEASCEVPLLIGIRPNGEHCMGDFDVAGGLPALLNEIPEKLDLSCLTVSGKTLGENIAGKKNLDTSVIHTLAHPLDSDGGLILCRGNLVPQGAFIKQSAVPPQLHQFRGQARVFHDQDKAIEALRNGEIKPGTVVCIVFQGVKAGPQTSYAFTTALKGSHLMNEVATITDGRLSGAACGACFGYASPEAALRGPLCAVRDGDWINYDIAKRELNIELSEEELEKRMAEADLKIAPKTGWLSVYQRCVGSILKGATLIEDNRE